MNTKVFYLNILQNYNIFVNMINHTKLQYVCEYEFLSVCSKTKNKYLLFPPF